ncbi:MarR family transcriptional regulator [Streptomyces sp. C11-1]|uniref:MarR family transcriptional regulator n=1 Tax=Streptomyces durocortorensis TaxID=2811104 RepID=A0ABY9VYY0_9ACTN|nr:MarR family transcriptional regulator [Streptomyces durocortorensis]WNF28755.1 MarR family transcriptional regulator [Streptomyces durocortorensis]
MAKPGYGKQSAPQQLPPTSGDFAFLPLRERYVAGFNDRLPEGALMSVKSLAKQLPLYGQQAIGTALKTLSVAGHLRRARCEVGVGDETRWVFRTYWSRTARDNEWWNAYLTAENAHRPATPAPAAPTPGTPDTAAPPPPPWVPAEEPPSAAAEGPEAPQAAEAPQSDGAPQPAAVLAPTPVPHQRLATGSETEGATGSKSATGGAGEAPARTGAPPSPAYLALAHLGRKDERLTLSAGDCAGLEALAAKWLARGVTVDCLTMALTAGLPPHVDHPLGFLRSRLIDKMPPLLPAEGASLEGASPHGPAPDSPRHLLVECTDCGTPGRPEALPDGLCRHCRPDHRTEPPAIPDAPDGPDVGAHVAGLRELLRVR